MAANQFINIVKTTAKAAGFDLDKSVSKAQTNSSKGELYSPIPDNWYKSQPYAFKAKRGDKYFIFYLPISPRNLNITTYFATNMVATLYGTVEEHSEQRYFDITISGTTGFAPQYVKEIKPNEVGVPESGRKRYGDYSISQVLGGFFPKTSAKLEQTLNQAGGAVKALTGTNGYQPGVFNNNSGYIAFHNLYKFLLEHKRSAAAGKKASGSIKSSEGSMDSGSAENSPLQFLNYKDNNQYSCVVQRFVLERNAENPMLYDYVINLRAYNLSPIINETPPELRDRIKDLGLDSTLSVAAMAKVAINSGKGAISSGTGIMKTLGA